MQVIEPVPVSDIFCLGVSKIEHLAGGLVRLWFYTVQASEGGAGPPENIVVAKIVIPSSAIPAPVMAALRTIEASPDFVNSHMT